MKLEGKGMIIFAFAVLLYAHAGNAMPLSSHLKKLSSAFASRNLDSLKPLIDPQRIFVEISAKPGSYLSPGQTLAVIESFFTTHRNVSFSYILVKEESGNGIALGSLSASENGRPVTRRVQFGFQKNLPGNWLLVSIKIR